MSGTERTEPELGYDEMQLLLGWLEFHRGALADNCAGLRPEQLVARSVPPSRLSLLGLVRHMTEMERIYLSQSLTGQPPALLYGTDEDPDGDFETLDPDAADRDLARWRDECRVSDEAIRRFASGDDRPPGKRSSVRWFLQKIIGEYARHNGHADLIWEAIDGKTGE